MIQRALLLVLVGLLSTACTVGVARPAELTAVAATRASKAASANLVADATDIPSTSQSASPPPAATSASPQTMRNTRTRPIDDMVMVAVPGGAFLMGSKNADIDAALQWCAEYSVGCQREWFEHEQPAHSVSLDSFWIDRTEVSNAQYKRCVDAGACQAPTTCHFGEPTFEDASTAEHPAICVDWYGAQAYCQWAGARLPTEAEWEYAARGPDGNTFPWGEALDGTRLNFCDANCTVNWKDTHYNDGYERTAPVQSFENGASWCGALNMAGNVTEWVDDWYNGYPGASYQNERFGTQYKVTRGNTWHDYLYNARSAIRSFHTPTTRAHLVGFRCAATSAP